ncbi:hypothetical protein CRH01_26110 [Chryseobacterium rhizosphaerae]|nr:hypothetical protein CRH01_26110 [Chryseobacterium rhizosphaerae]
MIIIMMTTGINPNNAYIPAKPSCADTLSKAIMEKIIPIRIDSNPKTKKRVSVPVIVFEEFFMVCAFYLELTGN